MTAPALAPAPAPAQRTVDPLLLLLTAPSGAGKTTVGKGLLAAVPNLVRAITCTTRNPRPGEQNGVDYHFLPLDDFQRRLVAGDFLEHANVYGNLYGTLRVSVLERLDAGQDVLLTIDVQGAESIRAASAADPRLRAALVSVFLTPPSLAEQQARLRGRDQDSPDVIARRLAMARQEIEHWPHFDYVVVSGSMADDLEAMRRILAVEKLRASRTRRLVVD